MNYENIENIDLVRMEKLLKLDEKIEFNEPEKLGQTGQTMNS